MSFHAEVFIQKFYTEIFQCGQTINSKVAVFVKVKSLSRVRLFATRWTVAYQAPPCMGFSRQEYWSGVPFPSPGDLPNPGIKPASPSLQADSLLTKLRGKFYTNRLSKTEWPEG